MRAKLLNESTIYDNIIEDIEKEVLKLSDIKRYIKNYDLKYDDQNIEGLHEVPTDINMEVPVVINDKQDSPFMPTEEERIIDETLKVEDDKSPYIPKLIEQEDIDNELDMLDYEEENEPTDEYVFHVRINEGEDDEIIAKIYKDEDDDNWTIRVVKGDEYPLQDMEFDSRLDKLEIIGHIADIYDEVEIMDKDEYEYLLDDKEKIDSQYFGEKENDE